MPEVSGELSIGGLEIGLASLHLTDVVVDLEGSSFVLIPSAAVNISYAKLAAAGFRPERALSRVIVSDPRIVISYGGEPVDGGSSGRHFDVASLEAYLPDYLGVSGATVEFRDARTGRRLVVDSIDLLLERTEDGPATGGASGSALGGADNVEARFAWNSEARTLSVDGSVSGAELDETLPIPPGVPFEFHSGTMTAAFRAAVSPDSIERLAVGFEVLDSELTVTSVDERLSVTTARGRFQNGVLTVDESSGRWRSSSWAAGGSLDAAAGSLEGVWVRADAVPLRPVAGLLGLDAGRLDGVADVTAEAGGTLASPVVSVSVAAASLSVGDVPLSGVEAVAALSPGSVEIGDLRGAVLGGTLSASGRLSRDPAAGTWRYEFTADALDMDVSALMARSFGDTTSSGRVSLTDIAGRGPLDGPEVEAIARWSGVSLGPVRLGSGAGGLLYSDGGLSVSAATLDRSFRVSGLVADVFDSPSVDAEVEFAGLPVDSLLPGPRWPSGMPSVQGTLEVTGPAAALSLGGKVTLSGELLAGGVDLTGSYVSSEGDDGGLLTLTVASPDASVRGVAVPFSGRLVADSGAVRVEGMRVGDFATADASLELAGGEISAGIVVSEADLPNVLTALFGASPEGLDGLVFASVSVHGTVSEPRATAQLTLGAGSALGVDGLDVSVSAELSGGVLTIDEAVLREAGHPVLTGGGRVLSDGALELALTGRGVPGPLLGGSPGTRFDVEVGIGGSADSPTLDGTVASEDGEFLGIPFDELSARVTGADGLLRVSPLVLERRGRYRATADGSVPVGLLSRGRTETEGTVTVEVSGNPIALLAEFTDVAECGPGGGSLSATLVSDGGPFALVSARLEAHADRVIPSGLFERIDDVEASVLVVDGAVVSGTVTGSVGGSTLRLRSARRVTADGRELPPLTAGGVDLGVLALSTEGNGVPASVPGLMSPDEYGRVALRGKNGEPEFFVAGPPERPFFWGEAELSDLSFTYPFADSDDRSSGNVLSAAEWSVRVVAGRNLWYRRADANLNVERGDALELVGVPDEHTMCVSGRVSSSRGSVTYLHTEFDVRDVTVDFPAFCEPARFSVDAETRVADGTIITLSMNTTEGLPALTASGVTLDESSLVLTSDSPDDNTPEEVMSKLQYGVSYDLLEAEEQAALERRRAVELIGTQLGLRIARPLLAPVESRIRRGLNLDLVRIDIDFVEHFLSQVDMWTAQEGSGQYLPFAADTRMTLGKYIARDWLVSYLGVVEPYEEEIGDTRLGLRSEFGIEYEVSRNTSLSLRVVYDPALAGWDRRVAIENRYEF